MERPIVELEPKSSSSRRFCYKEKQTKIYLILDSFPLALFTYMLFSMLLRQQRTMVSWKQLKIKTKIEDSTSIWCKYSA